MDQPSASLDQPDTTIWEDKWIPSVCTICYGGCAIKAHRVNGTIVKIEGNPDSPTGSGRLCAKGLAGMMFLYDPHRVNTPLRRSNPQKGMGLDPGWEPISWDQALDEICAKLLELVDQFELEVDDRSSAHSTTARSLSIWIRSPC